ncbi:glutamine amidotransferase [Thalassoglobus polymorphus]|uniref:Putative glutamine amidotransferase domain-containing protein n=1 Tax=Thalassoglobus polymorphus TaxID=2527994 RepID=A0A517QR77_9PLAN|nr:glutamine amidotransferase [Thalassoglobus polymorphus]QDT34131.1 hypothetical protein Mal48_33910 [Thalassoglobus polymorphus]
MRLVIEPVWSWPVIIVTAVTMIVLVLWTYPSRVEHLPPFSRRLLIFLRCCAAAILILAMLRPSIQVSETDKQILQLNILTDRSKSMSTPDGPGDLTRREYILKILSDNQEQFELLKKDVDVQFIDFDSELSTAKDPENLADGTSTAIGKVIDDIREEAVGERLIGMVMMSDGAQRAGGDDDVDPLSASRRFVEQLRVPIHTLVVGTSEVSTAGIDLAVADLQLDQSVTFEKKTVPVRFQLKLVGAAGKKVRVRLLIEDRNGKRQGESGELVEIPLSSEARPFRDIETNKNSVTVPVELSFVAEQAGEYKIAAEVVPDPGEVKLNNNRLETLITVRKGGLKVAYFDVPRPEQKFLRRLNETAKIQIDTQVILPGKFANQSKIDPDFFKKDQYDVYIIGDVPASVFENSGDDLLRQLALRVHEGAGLLMTGGLHNFGAGGYASTPLALILPVKMSPEDTIPLDQDRPEDHINTAIQMVPTVDGDQRYIMTLAASQNMERWEELPKLGGATRILPKSGAIEILAETKNEMPLLLASETGRGRVLALAVDETWKWHLHGFEAEHQRFWQQMILWLAHKEYESDQPLWARVEPRNFSPLSKVPLEFGAQTENGVPIPDANFQVEVLTPTGETLKVPPQRFGDHGLADFTETTEPGDYWVTVKGTHDGKTLGLPASTRFVIDSRDIEMDNPAADPGMMTEIAETTSGQVIPPENFGEFLESLRQEGIPEELKRYRRINLWDGWPPLLIFIGLMSLEWTIRKSRGLV